MPDRNGKTRTSGVAALALSIVPAVVQGQFTTWHDDSFTDSTGRTLLYRYWVRSDWDLTAPRGVVVYFHGNNGGTAEDLRQVRWEGVNTALRLGLAFVVPASPNSLPEGLSWGERVLVPDPVGSGGTRFWASLKDPRLIHELLQSNFKSRLGVDHDRVVFAGSSQGACFLAKFVEFYVGNYGGGFHAHCGCFWLDLDGDDFVETAGSDPRIGSSSPPFQWTHSATPAVRDRFKVFVEATTGDFLYNDAVSMSRYYSEWLRLKTRTDLEASGGHCYGGDTPLADIYDWLSSDAAPRHPGRRDDADGDGTPNLFDLDDDDDGALDFIDALPLDRRDWRDTDGDGVGDALDRDADGDGIRNAKDAFPLDPREWRDTDADGIGNTLDDDDDNDGLPDEADAQPLVGRGDGGSGLAFVAGARISGYSGSPFRSAHVLGGRAAGVVYPEAQGHSQSYQFLELGNSSDARFEIMVDKFVRPESCPAVLLPQLCDIEGYIYLFSSYFQDEVFRIWIDRNRSGNLTDDGPPLYSATSSGNTSFTDPAILEVPYAQGQLLPYAISVRPSDPFGVTYRTSSVWRGEVEVPSGGGRVLAIAVDGNVDGLFDGQESAALFREGERDFVCLDLNRNGWLEECDLTVDAAGRYQARHGAILPSEPFDWDGGVYSLSVAPWGREMTVVEGVEPQGNCRSSSSAMCLQGSRYEVTVDWRTADGESGAGQVASVGTADSGLFWFFSSTNWELLVKVLDGCRVNGHHWVFGAATTDVGYRVTVTDTESGSVRRYWNEPGQAAAAIADVTAFREACGETGATLVRREGARREPPPSLGSEQIADPSLALQNGRFDVRIQWTTESGETGPGSAALERTVDSGLFWFFEPSNWEMLVKVLDGCTLNDHYWVLAGSATTLGFEITVTDTQAGATRRYAKTDRRERAAAVLDAAAFPCGP